MELGAYSQCVLPGFGQQDGVLVWRGGFWEVVQDGEPVLEQLRPVVGEQKVQSLDVALLEGGGTYAKSRWKTFNFGWLFYSNKGN